MVPEGGNWSGTFNFSGNSSTYEIKAFRAVFLQGTGPNNGARFEPGPWNRRAGAQKCKEQAGNGVAHSDHTTVLPQAHDFLPRIEPLGIATAL